MKGTKHVLLCFFFKQKTAYKVRISVWSSDVCSSDLQSPPRRPAVDKLEHIAIARADIDDRQRGVRRSEECCVGKECGSRCRPRWLQCHSNKNHSISLNRSCSRIKSFEMLTAKRLVRQLLIITL